MTGFDFTNYRLVICLGPGGVGKTTLSAALAIGAAYDGRATDVMTIDPAPRLLDALGIEADAHKPQVVKLSRDAQAAGRLRAMRLDPKRTFDDLISRYAPSEKARDAILAGRIYQNLSNALAGVADYMAMERVLAMSHDHSADMIVLDTPPAADALHFLDAPRRMLELMNSRAAALLGASRGLIRAPRAIFDLAARAVLAAFDRLTGLHLLTDVQAFVRGFEGMYEGFAARAEEIQTLLRDPQTAIVLVTTAQRERIDQTLEFIEALSRMGLRVDALAVNRLMSPLPNKSDLARARLPADLKRKLSRNLADFAALKHREMLALEQLRQTLAPEIPILCSSDLGHEPRSLNDLAAIAKHLHRF